jgi:hypothetical protein
MENMPKQNDKPGIVHMDIHKLRPEPETNLPALSKAKLEALVDEAIVDAYGEEEQKVGLLTMMQEHLVLPFEASLLGVEATVEKVTMTRDGRIVAVCQRDGVQQRIDILDLPLPKPAPSGAEWIAAYSYWRRGL